MIVAVISDGAGTVCRIVVNPSAERSGTATRGVRRWLVFRTLLGYGALMALTVRHHWHQAGVLVRVSISVLAIVAVILWRYTLSRNLMDVAHSDFSKLMCRA